MKGLFTLSTTKTRLDFRIDAIVKGAPEAAARAIHEGMQLAFRQSQREVPVDKGTLKNSGQLGAPETTRNRTRVAITYGGAASAYAEIQHENRTLNHPGGGKAGFVIDPVRDAVPDMQRRLAAALRKLGASSA